MLVVESSLVRGQSTNESNRLAHRTAFMLKPTPRVDRASESGVNSISFGLLFELEESRLLRYAFSLTGRRAVAEEIVQEVFLQLHAQWDEVECPKAWLTRSVRNRAFSHVRDHKREVLHSGEAEPAGIGSSEESPEDHFMRLEATGAVRQLLGELNAQDQQLVKLKYFEGLKYFEISQRTGLTVSNVGYRLHHILKDLARKLRPLGIDKFS